MLHFFCECKYAQDLWQKVTCYLNKHFAFEDKLTNKQIILGNICQNSRSPVNTKVMATKQLMYSDRCKGSKCTIEKIIQSIQNCREIERYNAFRQGKYQIHALKWGESLDNFILSYVTEDMLRNDG